MLDFHKLFMKNAGKLRKKNILKKMDTLIYLFHNFLFVLGSQTVHVPSSCLLLFRFIQVYSGSCELSCI